MQNRGDDSADCKFDPGFMMPVIDPMRCEAKGPCVPICPYGVLLIRAVPREEKAKLSLAGQLVSGPGPSDINCLHKSFHHQRVWGHGARRGTRRLRCFWSALEVFVTAAGPSSTEILVADPNVSSQPRGDAAHFLFKVATTRLSDPKRGSPSLLPR